MKKLNVKRVEAPAEDKTNIPWERPLHWKIPETLGEEVDQALAEWYGSKGLPIPKEDVGIGTRIDKEERERFQREWKEYDELQKKQEDAPAGEKPAFGTPEFWAWASKRKKEKDAEREAQGLAPLPTKKEKEAAKTAKEAEKVKKAAEKVAKKAEKESKKTK
jgi:hypothetical protein